MSPLLETICIRDGKALHLDYHRQRMQHSSQMLFPGYQPPDPENLLKNIDIHSLQGTLKWRIIYGPDKLQNEIIPYTYKSIRTLKLLKTSIDYSHKFANRDSLDSLYEQRDSADDVLLVKDEKITDTTIANIVFLKDGKLFTPDQPLLMGTAIRRLLDEGKVMAMRICPKDISQFEAFWLVNALRVNFPFDPMPIDGIIR
ncbi:MAG: 4-amino-4-deoxychorismate lyase [Bacteroidales bacterium]|jgi:4-amino-4-deoxychorismate lyase|nr:4-amino-4-deoxychorismate lyase [Bacteroidales bacterium]MDN5329182.1 4-amino-4-deoxychorismate lyase [Bacteroidales bacterium]